MTKHCADQVFNAAGFNEGEGRNEVGVIELHDCFSANEVCFPGHIISKIELRSDRRGQLITYDALGLCPPGEAAKIVERGDNTVCPLEYHSSTTNATRPVWR